MIDFDTSWGRTVSAPPAHIHPLAPLDHALPSPAGRTLLARGLGRSYGDVCLNGGGTVLNTSALSRVLAFDRQRGIIRAEAGISLAALLAEIVPAGWFLPVTPGTKYVTLGGAIANDVHGKNHHRDGSFGRFVRSFELWRSDGARLACSAQENADMFSATIGGLGLTGLIRWAEIQLIPIESDRIIQTGTRFGSLAEYFALNEAASGDARYTVAWIDAMATGASRGRGIYLAGDHAPGDLPPAGPPHEPRWRVPLDAPGMLLNRGASRAFNALYWRRQRQPVTQSVVHYEPFFYPLDALGDWNRLYGRRGFFQYQFVVPHADAQEVVASVLERIAAYQVTAPLAVLKTFGDVPSPGMLSFPMPGVTLAVDFANEGDRTRRLFAELDALVRQPGGRLYPAKDACMTAEDFQQQYPRWRDFAEHVDPAFSSSFWRRVTE